MTHTDFPQLLTATNNVARFDRSIAALDLALKTRKIYNVEYEEIKRVLNRTLEQAWQALPIPYRELPEDISWFLYQRSVTSLHSLFSHHKQLASTQLEHPCIQLALKLVQEALPLAQAMKDAKEFVVKGRMPRPGNSPPKPVNPHKVVQTCPCCFRQIAVQNGRMVHHGYRRPGSGWQTSSCLGVRFPPLEVSLEGLEHLISSYEHQLKQLQTTLDENARQQKTPLHGVVQHFNHLKSEIQLLRTTLEKWKERHASAGIH